MKFGFFKEGKLVDSCYADNIKLAVSSIDHDEVHEILDANQLTGGLLNANDLIVTDQHSLVSQYCD